MKRLIALCSAMVLLMLCIMPSALAKQQEKGRDIPIYRIGPGGVRTRVELKYQSCGLCELKSGEMVPTEELVWETNAAPEQLVACIKAPGTGHATLRKTEKPKSMILRKLEAGRVVFVFDYGKKYTGVICGDTAGYVLTEALAFLGIRHVYGQATVAYNGSTTRKTNLRLRSRPNQSGQSLTAVNPGMRAVLLSQDDTWMQVDINGWHGFIRKKFLIFDEDVDFTPQVTAEPIEIVEDVMLDDDE